MRLWLFWPGLSTTCAGTLRSYGPAPACTNHVHSFHARPRRVRRQFSQTFRDNDWTLGQFVVRESILHLGALRRGTLGGTFLQSKGTRSTIGRYLSERGLGARCRVGTHPWPRNGGPLRAWGARWRAERRAKGSGRTGRVHESRGDPNPRFRGHRGTGGRIPSVHVAAENGGRIRSLSRSLLCWYIRIGSYARRRQRH